MYKPVGNVALTNISRETNYRKKAVHLSSTSGTFLTIMFLEKSVVK